MPTKHIMLKLQDTYKVQNVSSNGKKKVLTPLKTHHSIS